MDIETRIKLRKLSLENKIFEIAEVLEMAGADAEDLFFSLNESSLHKGFYCIRIKEENKNNKFEFNNIWG